MALEQEVLFTFSIMLNFICCFKFFIPNYSVSVRNIQTKDCWLHTWNFTTTEKSTFLDFNSMFIDPLELWSTIHKHDVNILVRFY